MFLHKEACLFYPFLYPHVGWSIHYEVQNQLEQEHTSNITDIITDFLTQSLATNRPIRLLLKPSQPNQLQTFTPPSTKLMLKIIHWNSLVVKCLVLLKTLGSVKYDNFVCWQRMGVGAFNACSRFSVNFMTQVFSKLNLVCNN